MIKTNVNIFIRNKYEFKLFKKFVSYFNENVIDNLSDDCKHVASSQINHISDFEEDVLTRNIKFLVQPWIFGACTAVVKELLNFLVNNRYDSKIGKEIYDDILEQLKCHTMEESFKKLDKMIQTPSMCVVSVMNGDESDRMPCNKFVCKTFIDAEKSKEYLISTHLSKEEARKEIEKRTGFSEDFCNEYFSNHDMNISEYNERYENINASDVADADAEYVDIRYNYEEELDVYIDEIEVFQND